MHPHSLMKAALLTLALGVARTDAGVLFQTGFESPDYTSGQALVGQGGWVVQSRAGNPLGPNAAVVTTSNPASGNQAVEVHGADLTPTDIGYALGSYRQFLNYDVAAAGMPVILVEADVRLDGPQTRQTGDRVTGDYFSANFAPFATDGYLGELSISSDGHLYGYSNDQGYLFGVPIQLGQYHHLGLMLNFATKTTTYLLNGQVLGSAAFDPGVTANILSRVSMVAYAAYPDPIERDPSAYTAYYDNISVTTVPEPAGLASAGVAGLLTIAFRRRNGRDD